MVTQKRQLDDYFHCKDVDFQMKDDDDQIETISRPTFLCNDAPDLIHYISEERQLDWNECMLKFQMDKGNNKMKAGLNIIEPEAFERVIERKKRAKYDDGIAPSLHLSTSATRMQILAMVPSIERGVSTEPFHWIYALQIVTLEESCSCNFWGRLS